MIANGFFPSAFPTALCAFGFLIFLATSEYDKVFPYKILVVSFQTCFWNVVPSGFKGIVKLVLFPAKYSEN